MNGYIALFKIRMKTLFQYRAAALAGMLTQFFWGILLVTIMRAFYAQATVNAPLSFSQAATFIWLGQALLHLLPWTLDKEIEAQVRNGNIVYELVRPLHLYGLWFSRSLALRMAPTLLRCLPIFIVSSWLGLSGPMSGAAAVAFGFSVLLAFFLSAAITTLVLISVFWTLASEGILRLLPSSVVLLSGMVVPLPLFPPWAQPFLNLQPFRGVMDIPCRLYTGVIPASGSLYYLGFQMGWIALLVLLGQWLLHKALQKCVIQGG